MRIARVRVHARRFCNSSGLRRAARRSSGIFVKAVALGLAPSLMTDVVLDHAKFSSRLFVHESLMIALNALITTGIFDVYLMLRK